MMPKEYKTRFLKSWLCAPVCVSVAFLGNFIYHWVIGKFDKTGLIFSTGFFGIMFSIWYFTTATVKVITYGDHIERHRNGSILSVYFRDMIDIIPIGHSKGAIYGADYYMNFKENSTNKRLYLFAIENVEELLSYICHKSNCRIVRKDAFSEAYHKIKNKKVKRVAYYINQIFISLAVIGVVFFLGFLMYNSLQ